MASMVMLCGISLEPPWLHSCCTRVLLGGGFLMLMKKAVFSLWSKRLNGVGTSLPLSKPWMSWGSSWMIISFIHPGTTPTMFFTGLPQPKDTGYKLRQRANNLTLPSDDNSTTKQNFSFRMLFDDMYWTVLFRILNVYLFRIFLLHLYS